MVNNPYTQVITPAPNEVFSHFSHNIDKDNHIKCVVSKIANLMIPLLRLAIKFHMNT